MRILLAHNSLYYPSHGGGDKSNRLLMEAQSLLATTSFSIKEIADRIGFSDANYFSSFFTRLMKISPTGYRAKFYQQPDSSY